MLRIFDAIKYWVEAVHCEIHRPSRSRQRISGETMGCSQYLLHFSRIFGKAW
ncbi:Protein of unknown function [Gryllus bimaculatus]|nr:Protein of unknown function [Gryllus bimaculatus]